MHQSFPLLKINKQKSLSYNARPQLTNRISSADSQSSFSSSRSLPYSSYSYIFIQHPIGQEVQSRLKKIKSLIGNDQRKMCKIAIQLTERIILLQKNNLFYPDALVLNEQHLQYESNQDLINKIKEIQLPKKLEDLIDFKSPFPDFKSGIIERFMNKHEQIRQFYGYEKSNAIYKEHLSVIEILDTALALNNQRRESLKNQGKYQNQIEKILKKFIRQENIRYLLYSFCFMSNISLNNPQTTKSPFTKYYYSLVAQDSQSRNIPFIKKAVSKLFKQETKQDLSQIVDDKFRHQKIDASQRNIEERNDAMVGMGNNPGSQLSTIFILKKSQNGESLMGLSKDQIRMLRLEPTIEIQSEKEHSKYIFAYKYQPVDIEKNNKGKQFEINQNNIKTNLKLNIIEYILNHTKENIAKYQMVRLNRDKDKNVNDCEYKMEKGEIQFSDRPQLSRLIGQKKQKIISFMTSLAHGITELEELGIYHADIKIQNFIQFKNIFQIIDFDHALMCNQKEKQFAKFKRMTEMAIQCWLTYKDNTFNIIFNRDPIFTAIKEDFLKKILNLEQTIIKCMQNLNHLQIVGHKEQFLTLFKQIFNQEAVLNRSQMFNKRQLQSLNDMCRQFIQRQERPDYMQFCINVNEMFNKYEEDTSNLQKKLFCGKKVQRVSQILKYESHSHEEYQQIINKVIQINKFLSKKQLKNISKPYFNELFIVRDDDEITDYKQVHRDDSHEISSQKQIWEEGQVMVYEVIYKLIKIVKQLEALGLHHPKLRLQSLVRKSQTVNLRHMHEAELFNKNIDQIRFENGLENQYNKKLGELLAFSTFFQMLPRGQHNFEGFGLQRFSMPQNKSKQYAKTSHMKQFKEIIMKLINVGAEQRDKYGREYMLFIRNQKKQIEEILNDMNVQKGYFQLQKLVKKKRKQKLLSSQINRF